MRFACADLAYIADASPGAMRRSTSTVSAPVPALRQSRADTSWYSPAQIDRMEKAGRFPKRVRLGPCRGAGLLTKSMRGAGGSRAQVRVARIDRPLRAYKKAAPWR